MNILHQRKMQSTAVTTVLVTPPTATPFSPGKKCMKKKTKTNQVVKCICSQTKPALTPSLFLPCTPHKGVLPNKVSRNAFIFSLSSLSPSLCSSPFSSFSLLQTSSLVQLACTRHATQAGKLL